MNLRDVDLPLEAWSLQNAQARREALARFWLYAPTDLLETLWSSPVGNTTTELVRLLKDDSQLNASEIALRNQINEALSHGLQQPLSPQLLIANFLFSPIGRLKIQNPEQYLPAWFVLIYKGLYEQGEGDKQNYVPLEASNVQQVASDVPIQNNQNQQQDLNQFPSNLEELVVNRIQLNRMLGLSNLHYIDPDDQEISEELIALRCSFANAIKACPEEKLESLWAGELNDRYWSMVRSGIQKQALSSVDEAMKQEVVLKLSPAQGGGFDKPGSINALLIAMLYFEPGTMTVNDPESNVPSWLLENFREIFMQTLPSS